MDAGIARIGIFRTAVMEIVDMDQSVKDDLVNEVSRFLLGQEWYVVRGEPYQPGIMFEGKSGPSRIKATECLCRRPAQDVGLLYATLRRHQLRPAESRIRLGLRQTGSSARSGLS